MYVLAVGNSFDGLTLYGPFEDAEETNDIGSSEFPNQDWHVVDLCPSPVEEK